MLVLSRKQNEEIVIGNSVCVKVVGIFGNKVRLGISAPPNVVIRRGELDFFERTSEHLPESKRPNAISFDIPIHDQHLVEHV